jgi:hypothetical protein
MNCVAALNNVAVALVKRRNYQEAVDTFRDAVRIAARSGLFEEEESVPSSSSSERTATAAADSDEFRLALRRAWKRQSVPERSAKGSDREWPVHAVNCAESPAEVYQQLATHPRSRVCVTLESDDDNEQRHDHHQRDLHLAVLMYNYGVASHSLALAMNESCDGAVKRLQIAESMLCRRRTRGPLSLTAGLLLARMLTEATGVATAAGSSHAEDSERYAGTYVDLIGLVFHRRSVLHPTGDVHAAAA